MANHLVQFFGPLPLFFIFILSHLPLPSLTAAEPILSCDMALITLPSLRFCLPGIDDLVPFLPYISAGFNCTRFFTATDEDEGDPFTHCERPS